MIDFLALLENYFGSEMDELYKVPSLRAPGHLLMGTPIWGEKYINRFGKFCLPSMLAEHNLKALQHRCRIVLFTDQEGWTRLDGQIKHLELMGIDYVLRTIPEEIMQAMTPKNLDHYWLLGTIHNLLLRMAARAQMGFHMLACDHTYADTYFPNLFRLAKDHEAICQTGISANVLSASEDLEAFRLEDGTLPVPDRDLGNIGWMNLHKQTQASLMNKAKIPNEMPNTHFLAWQGKDKLHLYCCHMNAAYMSPKLCAQAPTRIPATMDAELPMFMPDGFYVPKATDGMTFIELSDDTKAHERKSVCFEDFAQKAWTQVRYLDSYMPWFKTVCEVPIHEQKTFKTEGEIRREHAEILRMLYEHKAEGAYRLINSLAYKVG